MGDKPSPDDLEKLAEGLNAIAAGDYEAAAEALREAQRIQEAAEKDASKGQS